MTRLLLSIFALALVFLPAGQIRADAVVSNGKFTNVYVYPDPDKETWDQHLRSLPANEKPSDWQKFTSGSIDQFTEVLMDPSWPSYFGALHQYGGINPPQFFGSYVASQGCVNAAMKDLHKGVMEWTTIRSLSNCHESGMDPSPQVNLIFSPDIKIGNPALTANGPDICSTKGKPNAYHFAGLNTPNFAVLPTAPGCSANFAGFTEMVSHEDVEILSDPGGLAHGGFPDHEHELSDQCGSQYFWKGYSVETYRSDNDKGCWPVAFPNGSTAVTWVLGEGSPKIRFTGQVHKLTLGVPAQRVVSAALATQVQIWIRTGGDDLRAGSHAGDNADVTLAYRGGTITTNNVNEGREWGNNQTHIAVLKLPSGVRVQDILSATITTDFGGGLSGDNWNVDGVALMVAFPAGSTVSVPKTAIVHTWLDASGGPLRRFTGSVHDLSEPVGKPDFGRAISALKLIISTGNDDLRGGGKSGDNCDVTILLITGKAITVDNVNHGGHWANWTDNAVSIPFPPSGLNGGDIKSVTLHTGFGGGVGGDNWNVQRIRLEATLK